MEFAVITAGLFAITIGLAALWHAFDGGLFVAHALACASHHVSDAAPATIADLFLY